MGALIFAQILSGVMNMYGAYSQGKQDARAYKFQADQDEQNARAQAAETAIAEDSLRKQNRKQLAELDARMAESGLSGSTFDRVFTDSQNNLEQDALNLRYQGQSQWSQYKNSAAMNRYGVAMSKANATNAVWQTGLQTAVNVMGTKAAYGASGKMPTNGTPSLDTKQAQNIMSYQQKYAPWTR